MNLNNCTVHIGQYVEHQQIQTQYVAHQTVEAQEVEAVNNLPKSKDYTAVVEWLENEKQAGRDYYADARNNRAQMCRTISEILGWEVDRNSLGKVLNK